jgi:hypothetical protein
MILIVEFCGYDFVTTQEPGVTEKDERPTSNIGPVTRVHRIYNGKDERNLSKPCSKYDIRCPIFDIRLN